MSARRIALVAGAATVALVALGGTAIASTFGDDTAGPVPSPVSVSVPADALAPAPVTAPVQSSPGTEVSRERAVEIALAAVGGGTVREVEFDDRDDDGDDRPEWEIEIRDGAVEHDLEIDAATGDVREHDTDRDDNDDD